MIRLGERVTLHTPDNPRLDGAVATVELLTTWGAHVLTDAAGSGRFRALFSEMRHLPDPSLQAREEGYTGEACSQCGSFKCKRNGSCLLCVDCGSTSGCS